MVTSSVPSDGATSVSRDVFVSADVFVPNGGIDAATLSAQTTYLERSDGTRIPAVLNTSGGGDVIVLRPEALLDSNTSYTFVVTEDLKDTAGARFLAFETSFTTGTGASTGDTSVGFDKIQIPSAIAPSENYTALTIGPDGKLYAGTLNGNIYRFTINADGTLAGAQLINALVAANGGARSLIGLEFAPTATANNLTLYASHSTAFSDNVDWAGKISRMSGPDLATVTDVVVGLPRSIRDHFTNQLKFGPDGALYVLQGSNTSMGAPDSAWGFREERLLSAALLRVDLGAITSLPLNVRTAEGGGTYNPFAPAAPLTIYATGLRNAYDLLWHRNGHLYVPTNGSGGGGNVPATPVPFAPPYAPRIDGSPYLGPEVPAIAEIPQAMNDYLFDVVQGGYYGHPNETRREYVLNGGNPSAFSDLVEVTQYPVGVNPDRNWRGFAFDFGQHQSPNGVIEYKSGAFNGALVGKLLVVRFSGGDDVIALTPGQTGNIIGVQSGSAGLTGYNDPLDIVEDSRTGNLYIAEFSGARLFLLRPATVPSPPTLLSATAISANRINLTWVDNSSNEVGFKVERSTNGVDFSEIATLAPDVTAFSDLGVTPLTTYTYRVRGYTSAGPSSPSPTAAATTTAAAELSPSATFLRADTTTQGTWQGAYGRAGYLLVNDVTSLPAFAQVTPSGQANYTWAASTTDVRALQKGGTVGRLAAAWYTSATSSFTVDVNLTGGQAHQLALYAVDWDSTARSQRVEVLEAGTGAVLDSRDVSGFNGGRYLVWRVSGHVRLRVTKLGGANGVVSGVFFDAEGAPGPNALPSVGLSEPLPGTTFTAPASVPLKATASDSDGTITKVEFFVGSQLVGTDTIAPYEASWSATTAGGYTLTARATDNQVATAESAPVAVTVTGGSSGGGTASFVRSDSTTQGTWQGAYGRAGYLLVNDVTSLPAFAQVTPSGQANYTWAASTTDVRALQKGGTAGRLAAAWYTSATSSFTVDVNLTGGQAHQLALYAVDWDSTARSQRVEVLEAGTGAVLDSRDVSGFNGGRYLVWRVSGHVRLRVTKLGGANGVVSGVFFDAEGAPVPNAAPTVTLTEPTAGTTFFVPRSITLKAAAADADGTISQVEFLVGSQVVGTDTMSPYEVTWNVTTAGSYTLKARATDDDVAATESAPVSVIAQSGASSGVSVSFLGVDDATQGTWRGTYGSDGYLVVGDDGVSPSYAQVVLGGQSTYTWAPATGDPRAAQKANTSGRIAAAWYTSATPSFTIDINLTDGQAHEVALYSVDWDSTARSQLVEVLDAGTGAVLDSRNVTGFNGGRYLVWRLSGYVRLRVTRLTGSNGVVSALFFDHALATASPLVSTTAPVSGSIIPAATPVTIGADASDSDGFVGRVEFYSDSVLVGSDTTSPYGFTWNNPPLGEHSLTARAVDDQGAAALSLPVFIKVGIRAVMPLGDSITKGDEGGYRFELGNKLAASGWPVDFVGSLSHGPLSMPDKDHEGHDGWTIGQLSASVELWLSSHRPNTILLQIGTNDMIQNLDVANAPNRLSALIDKVTATRPGSALFVASITRLRNATWNQRVQDYNATIPAIVAAKRAAGQNVYFVDIYPAVSDEQLPDTVHPNAAGYANMATVWHRTLGETIFGN